MLPRFYGGDMTIAQPESQGYFAKTSLVATRLFFNNAGTPPGGVTKDTTAPKVGVGGWTAAPYYGFADRYNAGYVGTQNVWLWRGGGVGWDAGDSACYRIPCTVGATVAVRAYGYDGYGTASAPYIMKQKYSGGYRRQVSASPDMVQVQNGGSGAVMLNTFDDIDNVGYIDVRVEGSNYYCWCGLDYIQSANTGDLPAAWAF